MATAPSAYIGAYGLCFTHTFVESLTHFLPLSPVLENVSHVCLQLSCVGGIAFSDGVVVCDTCRFLPQHGCQHPLRHRLALDLASYGCRRNQRRRPRGRDIDAGVPHQALDLIGQLQLKVLRLVGFLQHHQVVQRHGIIHIRQVAVLRGNVASLRHRTVRVYIGRWYRRKIGRTPIANDALKCNGVRQRGGVRVDRHDRLDHPKKPRDDGLNLRLREVDLCKRPDCLREERKELSQYDVNLGQQAADRHRDGVQHSLNDAWQTEGKLCLRRRGRYSENGDTANQQDCDRAAPALNAQEHQTTEQCCYEQHKCLLNADGPWCGHRARQFFR